MYFVPGFDPVASHSTCKDFLANGTFIGRTENVRKCYKKCKEESKLFSFGINGTNRCVNGSCECFCHKNVTKEKTCNQTKQTSLNLYKVIEPGKS